jgi:zinc protease
MVQIPPVKDLKKKEIRVFTDKDYTECTINVGFNPLNNIDPDEQETINALNYILSSSALTSRIGIELRDKQGLAYSVRSQYLPMRQAGEFIVAIGTSPENIARAQQGFAAQITRIQQEPVSLEELQQAKGRVTGLYTLSHETTSQRCLDMAISHINGLGPDYSDQLLQRMQGVTVADVQAIAQRITTPSVTAIVARAEALPPE